MGVPVIPPVTATSDAATTPAGAPSPAGAISPAGATASPSSAPPPLAPPPSKATESLAVEKAARFAVAPSRLEFRVVKKKAAKHTLAAWSDDPDVTYQATVQGPVAEWLRITPQSRKSGSQRFNVEVAPAELIPGRHEATIEVRSARIPGSSVRVPVVVTVDPAGK